MLAQILYPGLGVIICTWIFLQFYKVFATSINLILSLLLYLKYLYSLMELFLAYQTNFTIFMLLETSRSSWRTEQWSLHWSSKLCLWNIIHTWKVYYRNIFFFSFCKCEHLFEYYSSITNCIFQRSCFFYISQTYTIILFH